MGPGGELAEVLAEVRRVEVLGRRLAAGAMVGGYGSVFRGAGIEFDDVREYEVGDEPRSIDWGVTARIGRPFVRRYVDERERSVLFLLDLSASMAGGFGPWSARQTAARVLACLALSASRNHDRAGLVAFGRGVESFVPARRGRGHVLRILRDCLALPFLPGGTDLVPALEFVLRTARKPAIVFVLSDFLCDGWEDALGRCARRHDVVAVRLLVPELDLPRAGLLRTRDPETGREAVLDTSDGRARAAFAAAVEGWRTRTARELARVGVDRMDVHVPRERSSRAVAAPILRFFRMREQRGLRR
jgi:uncharacterized protein (DUF58 family)